MSTEMEIMLTTVSVIAMLYIGFQIADSLHIQRQIKRLSEQIEEQERTRDASETRRRVAATLSNRKD